LERGTGRNVLGTDRSLDSGIAVDANQSAPSESVFSPFGLASPRAALVVGVATSLSILVGGVLRIFGPGGTGVWLALLPFAIFGAVVARRQPGNPIGTILLLLTLAVVASSDAGHYAVLRYRHGDHGLPLGRVAAYLAPGDWMWLVVFLPLPLALFPDGRLARGWRRAFWAYLVLGAVFVAVNAWQNVNAFAARHIQVDSKGQLTSIGSPASDTAYRLTILLYLGIGGLAWATRLLLSYRRSTGDYRQQLKWLLSGGTLGVAGLLLEFVLNSSGSPFLRGVGNAGLLLSLIALPVSLGIGILKYRLYDIDRLISRTLSYLIITGLLAGVFIGIVALATDVLPFSSPVAVAASTLAAAALFNPLRLRVQRLVDRRFNRARYDAEAIIAGFTMRLREAVDLDTVRSELLRAVNGAVQPAHASLWIKPPAPRSRP
jgi:hypothetical protein